MIPIEKMEILISGEQMQQRIQELAQQINRDYKGKSLLVVGILKGAVLFFSDLVRQLDMDVRFDFMTISSYGGSTESTALRELLLTRKPASFKICCMLDKPSRRKVEIKPDYCCFEIPDEFVIGYGLDYDQSGRQLKDVRYIKREYIDSL